MCEVVCLWNRQTKKPSEAGTFERFVMVLPIMTYGAPSGTRTRDTLIKSQGALKQGRQ